MFGALKIGNFVALRQDRLDVLLAEALSGLGRRMAREICNKGLVTVDGLIRKSGFSVSAGQVIEVFEIPDKSGIDIQKQHEIDVRYEDDHLMVVYKPSMIHSVSIAKNKSSSLSALLVHHNPALGSASATPEDGGLIHRLDYYTSGLLICAKTRAVWIELRANLNAGQIHKEYLALVGGRCLWSTKEVRAPLLLRRGSGKVVTLAQEDVAREHIAGRICPAETSFTLMSSLAPLNSETHASVVKASGYAMRRHQIRSHLSFLGHPLVGDTLYGSEHSLGEYPIFKRSEGFFLHAYSLSFKHPITSREMELRDESECPIRPSVIVS